MPSNTTVQPSVTAHVHPLVLLSATDHYNRVAKDTKKRVIGVLLGQNKGKTVNVSNSFAGKKHINERNIRESQQITEYL
jgi:26S proteasome regulatory subunit N8